MVDSSTAAAEAAETEPTNEHKQTGRKRKKTRAQMDKHNASCQKSRRKLKADNLEVKKKLDELQVELQSMDTKLKEMNSENTLLRTALRILGEHNTSLNEMVTEFVSVIDGQGSGFPTASTAGSIFVENPKLAAAIARPTSDHVTDYDLAAAGSSLIAGHDLPVKFYAPNNHDIFSNLSTHPAAGFSTSSAAGSSSGANHKLHARKSYDISSLFAHDPVADNKAGHDLPVMVDVPSNHDTICNLVTHDPAADNESGFPTASAAGSFVAYPELTSAFGVPYNPSTSDLFTDHDLAAGHESPVMFDAPNNPDAINNLSTHNPAAGSESGFPGASATGSSSYDTGGLFTQNPAADYKAGFSF